MILSLSVASISQASAATLSPGSAGTDVSSVQQFLKVQGFYTYPTITGYFGSATKDAVIAFQKSQGIDPLGIVGPTTASKNSTAF